MVGVTNGASDRPQIDHEVSGEVLREAIKNGDITAVKKLLNEGQVRTVFAAVFNQTYIVFILMDSGASLQYKNAQGETPFRLCSCYVAIQNAKEDRRRWSDEPKYLNNLELGCPEESFKYYEPEF
ncbi:hypothetical protein OROMI_023085 [Orobanche minor]